MLSKIIGSIWILLGLLWLWRPEALRAKLGKKISRKLRWVVYGFVLVFSFLMIGNAFRAQGWFLKIMGIIGMFIAIKVILLITSKTQEKMFAWLGGRPVIFFRILAGFFIALGVSLFIAH